MNINNPKEQPINLLSIEEVCSILGIKKSKCRSMVFKKEIPYIKIGRLVRFDKQEIEEWLNQLKRY